MPDWLLSAIATGGPASALIMSYMWWRAEARCARYEELWVKASSDLPERIISFAEQHRQTTERLARAVRECQREHLGGGPYRRRIPISEEVEEEEEG